ncbi:MAG TPA: hypothetical protein VMM83_05765 [Longimicrobiales bacterium]|nr:hypothetical protein [Longimicrobiales bacterium]
MPHLRSIVILAVAGAAGCVGSPPPGSPDGPPLQYQLPYPPGAAYTFSDTTEFSIDAGPIGPMVVRSALSGAADVAFHSEAGVLQATVRVPSFSGRFENPNQGVTSADESDIRGVWTVRLEPRGLREVVDSPSLTAAGRAVAAGASLIRPLFASLPGRPAGPGAEWVDTVMVTEEAGGVVSRVWSVVTSTLAGDTAVAGTSLLLIRTSTLTQVEVEGSSGGVEILQRMSGTLRGSVLWDGVRSMLVGRWETGALDGTIQLPGMGVSGLPVQGTVRRSVWLRP